jgi:hypothetical protein
MSIVYEVSIGWHGTAREQDTPVPITPELPTAFAEAQAERLSSERGLPILPYPPDRPVSEHC